MGNEGVAYEYAAPPESDEEQEELTPEVWALEVESEEEVDSSEEADSDEERSLHASPPPDDARCKIEGVRDLGWGVLSKTHVKIH